jgi:hypothetical protein
VLAQAKFLSRTEGIMKTVYCTEWRNSRAADSTWNIYDNECLWPRRDPGPASSKAPCMSMSHR